MGIARQQVCYKIIASCIISLSDKAVPRRRRDGSILFSNARLF